MKIKLVAGKAVVEGEMPEIIDLTSDEVIVEVSNYSSLKGRLSVRVSYDDRHKDIEICDAKFSIPSFILTRDVKSIVFTLLSEGKTKVYDAPVEKFKLKGLINIADKDRLLELLTVLYNKYVELEAKYEKLDSIVSQGDLLI